MDFETLRTQMTDAVPFVRYVGVEITMVGDGVATARLTQSEPLSNHIGTIHAGAIFTLAETASGAAMLGAFADVATAIRPLATEAKISYLKLGRGTIRAQARTDIAGAQLREQLRADSATAFAVTVNLQDERDREIALVNVQWRVTMPKITAS